MQAYKIICREASQIENLIKPKLSLLKPVSLRFKKYGHISNIRPHWTD